jgi:hypothetical protein
MKLDYIDIPETIKRLRDACGMDVSWEIDQATLEYDSENGKFLGFVQGHLVVKDDLQTSKWGGVGAMVDKDPDMAIKTATAEAIKKAGHGFGIALYLWDPEERDAIAAARTASTSTNVNALKKAVALNAKVRGVDPITPSTLAKFYDVSMEELHNPDTLRRLLEP